MKHHSSLNSVKGVIFNRNLADVDEKELVYTGRIVLTFDRSELPSVLGIAWNKFKIKPYTQPHMMQKLTNTGSYTKMVKK